MHFGVFVLFKAVDYSTVFAMAPNFVGHSMTFFNIEFDAYTIVCILLFVGSVGKSAQLGLHTWLPDAMEGPTPVSALIHAATMVTAGVFLGPSLCWLELMCFCVRRKPTRFTTPSRIMALPICAVRRL